VLEKRNSQKELNSSANMTGTTMKEILFL